MFCKKKRNPGSRSGKANSHMSATLQIQACSVKDVGLICEVAIKSYNDYYLYLWYDDGGWYINRSFSRHQVEKEIQDPNAAFFLLKSRSEYVGFMKLNIDQPLPGYEEMKAMELERIYLLKSASGKGFGRQAMQFCFNRAKQRHKELLWLKSMDSSQAINFYKRMGFVECGQFQLDFEMMKPEFRGMVILKKPLQDT